MSDYRRKDNAKLPSAIATNAEAARAAGAQEVSQNLLRNPLVCQSAKALQISVSALLRAPGSMSEAEAAEEQNRRNEWQSSANAVNLMAEADKDANALIALEPAARRVVIDDSNKNHESLGGSLGAQLKPGLIEARARRPLIMEDLTLSEFSAAYEETTLSKSRLGSGSCNADLLIAALDRKTDSRIKTDANSESSTDIIKHASDLSANPDTVSGSPAFERKSARKIA